MSKTLADRVVNTSLRVKPDETVVVNTWQHTIGLASEIAFECRNAGAIPIIRLETDDLWWKVLNKIPGENLRKPERHALKMLEETDVSINLGGPEDPVTYRRVDGEKLAASFESFQQYYEKLRERKIRSADLLIGQVTKQRAKTYGFNYARWKKIVEDSSDVDYRKMAQLGRKVAYALEGGKQIEVTTNQGTKLKLEIGSHPVHIDDGILDEEDLEKGLFNTAIPTGLVVTAPLPASAEGTVYFDMPRAQKGRLIKGLKWEFQSGRVVKASAEKYPEAFLDIYNNATGDKDIIASFAIGINPESRPIGFQSDEFGLGIVSVGIGENRFIGGNNNSDYGFTNSLAKATVRVDGKNVVEKGKLVF